MSLYTRYRLSYIAQSVTVLISIPFCVMVWPQWSWPTAVVVNLAFLPVSLVMVYHDRKREARAQVR